MYYNFRPHVSVAERRRKTAEAIKKMSKSGIVTKPVRTNGRVIAKTFWGKSWCDHLESFSDYENRLPRGRSYLRNGSVVHLSVEQGRVEALVQGSSLYKIKIDIKPIGDGHWKQVLKRCSGQIDSLVELLQGKLSSGVMKTITDNNKGLFPKPAEISLNCSCPDWADMCKHVAAVLYGVGTRLDEEPELLFKLRHVDHLDLINKATLKTPKKRNSGAKIVRGQNLSNLFGIEIDVGKAADPTEVRKSSMQIQKKSSAKKLSVKTRSK